MNTFIIFLSFFAILSLAPRVWSQGETNSVLNGVFNEEAFLLTNEEFEKIANPFLSKLPKIEQPLLNNEVIFQDDLSNQERPLNPSSEEQVPPKPEEIPLPPLVVNGFIWDSDHPQAIINNQVVGLNESINDVTVTGISRQGLTVLYRGKKFQIILNN